MAEYVVLAQASSRAMFAEGSSLAATFSRRHGSPLALQFNTRYLDLGFATRLPGKIQIEVRGSFPSVKDAFETCANRAGDILSVLGVVANSWRGPVEVRLAYDNTPDQSEHDFVQVYVPENSFEGPSPSGTYLCQKPRALSRL